MACWTGSSNVATNVNDMTKRDSALVRQTMRISPGLIDW